MAYGDYYGFAPYVSVAERRKRAARKLKRFTFTANCYAISGNRTKR